MPSYTFQVDDEHEPSHIDLPNDQVAWSQAVTLCGELLREMDGTMPVPGSLHVVVRQELQVIAEIRVEASLGSLR